MKATRPPYLYPATRGPWGVAAIGRHWYVVHSESLRAKCIGRTNNRGTNYFDRAIYGLAIKLWCSDFEAVQPEFKCAPDSSLSHYGSNGCDIKLGFRSASRSEQVHRPLVQISNRNFPVPLRISNRYASHSEGRLCFLLSR